MKCVMSMILSLIMLIPSVGLSDGIDNAIIIPIELFERIIGFNNDYGEWKEYGYDICSAYLPNLKDEECRVLESFLSTEETLLGKVKGYLSIDLPYSKGQVDRPHEIYARVTDPIALSYSDSKMYNDTIKYYSSILGTGEYIAGEHPEYQISNEKKDILVRIIYTDDDTIDTIQLYILRLSRIKDYHWIM